MYGVFELTENFCYEYHCQYGLPVVINKMSLFFVSSKKEL